MGKKTDKIDQIMDLLEGNYTNQSDVYRNVKKALNKLSNAELGNLYAMLLCEVKVKLALPRKEKTNGE